MTRGIAGPEQHVRARKHGLQQQERCEWKALHRRQNDTFFLRSATEIWYTAAHTNTEEGKKKKKARTPHVHSTTAVQESNRGERKKKKMTASLLPRAHVHVLLIILIFLLHLSFHLYF